MATCVTLIISFLSAIGNNVEINVKISAHLGSLTLKSKNDGRQGRLRREYIPVEDETLNTGQWGAHLFLWSDEAKRTKIPNEKTRNDTLREERTNERTNQTNTMTIEWTGPARNYISQINVKKHGNESERLFFDWWMSFLRSFVFVSSNRLKIIGIKIGFHRWHQRRSFQCCCWR